MGSNVIAKKQWKIKYMYIGKKLTLKRTALSAVFALFINEDWIIAWLRIIQSRSSQSNIKAALSAKH
jgi:hypothetical protein